MGGVKVGYSTPMPKWAHKHRPSRILRGGLQNRVLQLVAMVTLSVATTLSLSQTTLANGASQGDDTNTASSPWQTLYQHLQQQKSDIPLDVKNNLYLTNIDIDSQQRQVFRTYQFANLDYGRTTAYNAKRLQRQLAAELYQQCDDHRDVIFDSKVSFHYRFIDKTQRVIAINVVDQTRCTAYAIAHPS